MVRHPRVNNFKGNNKTKKVNNHGQFAAPGKPFKQNVHPVKEKKNFPQKVVHIQQNAMRNKSGNHFGREPRRNRNRSRPENDLIRQLGRLNIASTSTNMNLSSYYDAYGTVPFK